VKVASEHPLVMAVYHRRYNQAMDLEEIQDEIMRLAPPDIDCLADWLAAFRKRQHAGENQGSVVNLPDIALSTMSGSRQGVVTDDPEELAERARELEELKANLKRWREDRG